jgi:hypothetical protein
MPAQQSPYVAGAAAHARGGVDQAQINAQALAEKNPWDALRTAIASYPGVYGPAVQGTVAQNITQMNNELAMNKLAQILPFLRGMGGGMQTDYGAGYG